MYEVTVMYFINNLYMLLNLLSSFYDKNKIIIILYFVIVFLLLPIEAVIVPELYGKLFDTLKEINEFPSIFDIFNNVKAQNL